MHALAEPCPSCGAHSIRPSRWRLEDLLFSLRLCKPLRCRACGDRFYIRLWDNLDVPQKDTEAPETQSSRKALRVRVKNPNRLLRALLLWIGEPEPDPRIE